MGYPSTSNFVKNTPLRVVLSTLFSLLDIPMKHCLSCLIYYIIIFPATDEQTKRKMSSITESVFFYSSGSLCVREYFPTLVRNPVDPVHCL